MPGDNIYTSNEFLDATDGTWHAEDSPWKAQQVMKMISKHHLRPNLIGEVGCGSGVALLTLSKQSLLEPAQFTGYDISPHAIAMAKKLETPNLRFHQGDPLAQGQETFDILLALDVFEHVPDYMSFLERCQRKATYKIYHVPLDIHVSSVVRNILTHGRYTIGHLHYFTAETALDTLRDTGHEIVDYFYTDGAIALFGEHRTLRAALANVPRWLVSRFSIPLAARWFGGYSLLVLAK